MPDPTFVLSIDGFGDFPATLRQQPELIPNVKPTGKTHGAVWKWPLTGYLVGDDAAVEADRQKLEDLFLNLVQPRTVRFKKDGVDVMVLEAGQYNNSPRFERFKIEDSDGNWSTNLKFTVDVVAQRGIIAPDVWDVDRTFEEIIRSDGSEFRDTILARGNGAEVFVKSLEPPDVLERRFVNQFDNNTFIATYVRKKAASALQGDAGIEWEETIRISKGIESQNWARTMGGTKPRKFIGPLREAVVVVTGTFRASKPGPICIGLPFPPGFTVEDLAEWDDGPPKGAEFDVNKKPTRFERTYTLTFGVEERPNLDELCARAAGLVFSDVAKKFKKVKAFLDKKAVFEADPNLAEQAAALVPPDGVGEFLV